MAVGSQPNPNQRRSRQMVRLVALTAFCIALTNPHAPAPQAQSGKPAGANHQLGPLYGPWPDQARRPLPDGVPGNLQPGNRQSSAPKPSPQLTERVLTLAVWNLNHLSDAEAEAIRERETQPQAVWRNTFGAERTTAAQANHASLAIPADVTVVQGITNLKDVRQIYTARSHHMVVSRGGLSDLGINPRHGASHATATGMTAIVMRRRPGLRLTAQRHFIAPRLSNSATLPQPAPALAVRLAMGPGESIWITSLNLNPECHADHPTHARPPECDGERLLISDIAVWLDRTAQIGEQVIVAGAGLQALTAGREHTATKPPRNSGCSHTRPALATLPTTARPAGDDQQAASPPTSPTMTSLAMPTAITQHSANDIASHSDAPEDITREFVLPQKITIPLVSLHLAGLRIPTGRPCAIVADLVKAE